MIGDVLRRGRPGICGLQEVWAESGRNLAGELAEELGMRWAWVRSPERERWHAGLPGCSAAVVNAILARCPIRDSFQVLLPPVGSGDASRTAIVATVESPDGRIPLATTQLTSAPWDPVTRARRSGNRWIVLAGLEREDYPVVVLGDMNAEPDSDEVRLLLHLRWVRRVAQALVAWRATGVEPRHGRQPTEPREEAWPLETIRRDADMPRGPFVIGRAVVRGCS